MECETKNTPYRGPPASAPGGVVGDRIGGAITAGRVRGARPSRVRGADTRGTGDGTFERRWTRRVARGAASRGSRARSSLSEFPAWSRAKKKTLSSADAREKRAVGRRATLEQGPCAARNDRGGCRSMFPRRARVPSSAPRATARFPATASRDIGSLRRSRTTIWSGARQISQSVRTLEAVVRRAARTGARRAGRPTAAMADILEVVVFEVLRVLDGCSNAHQTGPPLEETRPERAGRISRGVSTNQSAP